MVDSGEVASLVVLMEAAGGGCSSVTGAAIRSLGRTLAEDLREYFGPSRIYRDIDSNHVGADFTVLIGQALTIRAS